MTKLEKARLALTEKAVANLILDVQTIHKILGCIVGILDKVEALLPSQQSPASTQKRKKK